MFQIIRHYASMLIPAVSVLATNAVARGEQPPIDWGRLPLEYVPVALLLMPLVMHAAMLPTAAALDGLHWQGWRQVREARSVVGSGSAAYSNITAAPHEYFYHTGFRFPENIIPEARTRQRTL
jgi:hypothetical protein